MEYRVSFASSPRLYWLVAIMVAFVLIAAVLFFLVHPIAGIIAGAIAAYMDFQLYRFMKGQLKGYIRTDDEGVSCLTALGDKVRFEWSELTHAGTYKNEAGKANRWGVFLYDENQDSLVSVPSEFSDLEQLAAEVQEHAQALEFDLSDGKSLRERLQETLGVDSSPDAVDPPSESS